MHDSWPTQVKDYMRRVVLPGLDRLWKITLRSMCDEFSIILCANLGSPIDEDWIILWNRITQECSLYDWIEKTLFGYHFEICLSFGVGRDRSSML